MDLQAIFSWINTELGWGEYSPPLSKTHRDPRSLKTLWDELVDQIPYSTVLAWFLEMWTINTDMQLLVERMMSPATERIRDHLHTCPAYLNYRSAVSRREERGVSALTCLGVTSSVSVSTSLTWRREAVSLWSGPAATTPVTASVRTLV